MDIESTHYALFPFHFRSRIQKDRERDISEKIALGLPNTGAAQQDQFDQRLFNQSKVCNGGGDRAKQG